MSKQATFKTQGTGNSLVSGIGIIIWVSLFSVLFWMFYEVGSNQLYQGFPTDMREGRVSMLGAGATMLFCVFFFIFGRLFNFNPWYKVAAGFLIVASSWFMLSFGLSINLDTKQLLILVLVLHSMAEVVCSVVLMSIIAKNAYQPLLGTSFSIHFYAATLASFLASLFSSEGSRFETLGWACLGVAVLLAFTQVIYYHYSKNKQPLVEV